MSNTNADDTDHYEGAMLEDINDKLQGIAEAVGGLSHKVNEMDEHLKRVEQHTQMMDGRLNRVEQHTELLPAIENAVMTQSTDLDDHDHRITRLERKTA